MADQQVGNVHGLPVVAVGDADSKTNLSGTAVPQTGFVDTDLLTITAMKTRLATVAGTDAIIALTHDGTGGTFTLTHNGDTTGNIAYNADAATIKTALEALDDIDTVTVTGSADDFTVEFTGDAVKAQPQTLTGDDASLTGDTAGLVIEDSVVGITYYDEARLNQMTYNDLVYAVRLADHASTISQ